jgi:hypothetical protein
LSACLLSQIRIQLWAQGSLMTPEAESPLPTAFQLTDLQNLWVGWPPRELAVQFPCP